MGRIEILAKTKGMCAYCGVILTLDRFARTSFHIDHAVAKAKGGPKNADWNKVPACLACNQFKGDADPEFVRLRLAYSRGQYEVLETCRDVDGKILWILQRAKTELIQFYAEDLIAAAVERFRLEHQLSVQTEN